MQYLYTHLQKVISKVLVKETKENFFLCVAALPRILCFFLSVRLNHITAISDSPYRILLAQRMAFAVATKFRHTCASTLWDSDCWQKSERTVYFFSGWITITQHQQQRKNAKEYKIRHSSRVFVLSNQLFENWLPEKIVQPLRKLNQQLSTAKPWNFTTYHATSEVS